MRDGKTRRDTDTVENFAVSHDDPIGGKTDSIGINILEFRENFRCIKYWQRNFTRHETQNRN